MHLWKSYHGSDIPVETVILHTLVYSLTSDITKSYLQVTQKHQWCSCSTLKTNFGGACRITFFASIFLYQLKFDRVWTRLRQQWRFVCGFCRNLRLFFATVEKIVKKKNWSRNLTVILYYKPRNLSKAANSWLINFFGLILTRELVCKIRVALSHFM